MVQILNEIESMFDVKVTETCARTVPIMVFNPGKTSFDKRNPGLLYTGISRATSLGCEETMIQILNEIESMFDVKVTETCAPTGCAAYNIFGKTIHSLFCINVDDPSKQLSPKQKYRRPSENQQTYLRFEFAKGRGQIHAHILASALKESFSSSCYPVEKWFDLETRLSCDDKKENVAAMLLLNEVPDFITVDEVTKDKKHDNVPFKEIFGGIPVVLILGDDIQLPPVRQLGALDTFQESGFENTLLTGSSEGKKC